VLVVAPKRKDATARVDAKRVAPPDADVDDWVLEFAAGKAR
jgi:hypothetical protein